VLEEDVEKEEEGERIPARGRGSVPTVIEILL